MTCACVVDRLISSVFANSLAASGVELETNACLYQSLLNSAGKSVNLTELPKNRLSHSGLNQSKVLRNGYSVAEG